MMKDKNIVVLLSFFLGMFGAHRFYLGQTKLGILYCVLSLVGISFLLQIIDFFVFLFMDQKIFDLKYNSKYVELQRREEVDEWNEYDHNRSHNRRSQQHRANDFRKNPASQKRRSAPAPQPDYNKMNPYKASGIQRYKAYEYEEAIEDFLKVLETEPNDISVHFNLACANSLLEQKEEAYYHLNRAIELGFKDYHRIRNHDALAYLRLQPEYEALESRVMNPRKAPPKKNAPIPETPNLLEQIKELGALRERGLLTEEEFVAQKKKLLG